MRALFLDLIKNASLLLFSLLALFLLSLETQRPPELWLEYSGKYMLESHQLPKLQLLRDPDLRVYDSAESPWGYKIMYALVSEAFGRSFFIFINAFLGSLGVVLFLISWPVKSFESVVGKILSVLLKSSFGAFFVVGLFVLLNTFQNHGFYPNLWAFFFVCLAVSSLFSEDKTHSGAWLFLGAFGFFLNQYSLAVFLVWPLSYLSLQRSCN